MNPTDLMVASVLAQRGNDQLFRPFSHEEFVRMERARRARAARRAARIERSRRLGAAARRRIGALIAIDAAGRRATIDSPEREATALRA